MLYRRLKCSLAFIGFSVFLSISTAAQSIIYVNQAATGAGNGTSWTHAFINLQDALLTAQGGDEVWVAQGTYRPDQGTGISLGDPTASFVIDKSLSLYGGFNGREQHRDERNAVMNPTRLSGDLLADDQFDDENGRTINIEDNTLHIIRVVTLPVDVSPVLDGLIVSGGNAKTTAAIGIGGGIFIDSDAHAEIRNVKFTYNTAEAYGGAIGSYGSLTVADSYFYGNYSGYGGAVFSGWLSSIPVVILSSEFVKNRGRRCGGAVSVFHQELQVIDTLFLENRSRAGGAVCDHGGGFNPSVYVNVRFVDNWISASASYSWGGAIRLEAREVRIVNALFNGNEASKERGTGHGGAISFEGDVGSLEVVNSTFAHNYAAHGGVIWLERSPPMSILNSVIWSNTTIVGDDFPTGIGENNLIRHTIAEDMDPYLLGSEYGNLNTNPLFVDAVGPDGEPGTWDDDLRLEAESPGVDAGANEFLPLDEFDLDRDGNRNEQIAADLDSKWRVYDGGSGNSTVDMGAYEFGSNPIFVPVYVASVYDETDLFRMKIYPNPARTDVRIRFQQPVPDEVRLILFDMLGRRVSPAMKSYKTAGRQEIVVNVESLPAGSYLLVLSTADIRQSGILSVVR